MRKLRFTIGIVACAAAILVPTAGSVATGTRAETKPGLGTLCASVLAPITGGVAASGEPFAACQWDMVQIHATTAGSHTVASGIGVRVGVIDSGVDLTHPDIAPNLDWRRRARSSHADTPAALPIEVANGDCSNKAAVRIATVTAHTSPRRSPRRQRDRNRRRRAAGDDRGAEGVLVHGVLLRQAGGGCSPQGGRPAAGRRQPEPVRRPLPLLLRERRRTAGAVQGARRRGEVRTTARRGDRGGGR